MDYFTTGSGVIVLRGKPSVRDLPFNSKMLTLEVGKRAQCEFRRAARGFIALPLGGRARKY